MNYIGYPLSKWNEKFLGIFEMFYTINEMEWIPVSWNFQAFLKYRSMKISKFILLKYVWVAKLYSKVVSKLEIMGITSI